MAFHIFDLFFTMSKNKISPELISMDTWTYFNFPKGTCVTSVCQISLGVTPPGLMPRLGEGINRAHEGH